jgi:3-methyladenine DNA glycosylase AlkD
MAILLRNADRKREVVAEILRHLQELADPKRAEGAGRFGVRSTKMLGISVPQLRTMAKDIGVDHALAAGLWDTGILEARLLASLIGDPQKLTAEEMENWAGGFDSWAVCDGFCCNLFDKSPLSWKKAVEWARRDEEYVKRAAFALMAGLAAHDKLASDVRFLRFLPLIQRASDDDRNFVRKAVNWALRGIGKRNLVLNAAALETARNIHATGTRSGRWIAADAIRELGSEAVQGRLTLTATNR